VNWVIDVQGIINILLGSFITLLCWLAMEMWSAVKELKTDLGKLREDLPRTYVLKEDYRRDIYEIKDMLSKIFDRLDAKADKP
tara:strand:+ start:3882 stop:4130 length:249 start_codon:yes stop_codon:yes gene_type:complete